MRTEEAIVLLTDDSINIQTDTIDASKHEGDETCGEYGIWTEGQCDFKVKRKNMCR